MAKAEIGCSYKSKTTIDFLKWMGDRESMVWFYLAPQIWHGHNALEVLFERISANDRVTVITDPRVQSSEFFSHLIRNLSNITKSVTVFNGVNATPDITTIEKCANLLSQSEPNWVIGVGGGSVLDTAKTGRLLYENPRLELDLKDGILLFQRNTPRSNQRSILVAIPTTTGTGSEATYGMMVKSPNPNELSLVAGYQALAEYAILDPGATASLPKEILAATAMDALGQSIEAYTSVFKNDFADGHALVSISLIFEWLRQAYENPADADARLKLQNAACLSGLAFGNAPGGLAHAIADAFSPRFNFHHGRAVGIVLPYVMEFNSADSDSLSMYSEIAHHVGIRGNESKKVRTLISKIRELREAVGVPNSMKRAGISKPRWKSAMEQVVHRTLEDGILKNRRTFDGEDAAKVLWCVWNGRQVQF